MWFVGVNYHIFSDENTLIIKHIYPPHLYMSGLHFFDGIGSLAIYRHTRFFSRDSFIYSIMIFKFFVTYGIVERHVVSFHYNFLESRENKKDVVQKVCFGNIFQIYGKLVGHHLFNIGPIWIVRGCENLVFIAVSN